MLSSSPPPKLLPPRRNASASGEIGGPFASNDPLVVRPHQRALKSRPLIGPRAHLMGLGRAYSRFVTASAVTLNRPRPRPHVIVYSAPSRRG